MFKRTCLWEHNAGGELNIPFHYVHGPGGGGTPRKFGILFMTLLFLLLALSSLRSRR